MKDLIQALRPALISLAAFTLLLGIGYPLIVGVVGWVAMPRQAHGALEHVGQPFDDVAYFWSRPSAIGFAATTSGGRNAGPSGFVDNAGTLGANPALVDAVTQRIAALRAADPGNLTSVPVDLVTTSSSGLDPHISVANARLQAARVARERGLEVDVVLALVGEHTDGRTFGLLGEPGVNVLMLNLALDDLSAAG